MRHIIIVVLIIRVIVVWTALLAAVPIGTAGIRAHLIPMTIIRMVAAIDILRIDITTTAFIISAFRTGVEVLYDMKLFTGAVRGR